MDNKYRIVQVAPLTHQDAFQVQYKSITNGWVMYQNYNSLSDAHHAVITQMRYEKEKKKSNEELQAWKRTHGDFQVVKEY